MKSKQFPFLNKTIHMCPETNFKKKIYIICILSFTRQADFKNLIVKKNIKKLEMAPVKLENISLLISLLHFKLDMIIQN